MLDQWVTPRDWNHVGGLSFSYRGEGGIFVLMAVGRDGDVVVVEELPLYRKTACEAGRLIAEVCQRHPGRLTIATGEEPWADAGIGAPTVAEEIQRGVFEVYGWRFEIAPRLMQATGGPGSDAARLAVLRRYVHWTRGPDGKPQNWGRPRLRVAPGCRRVAEGLASLALDPANPERALSNPVYDALTAALMSRPPLPERSPERVERDTHPGLDPVLKKRRDRMSPWERALREPDEPRTGCARLRFHMPRGLVPYDDE